MVAFFLAEILMKPVVIGGGGTLLGSNTWGPGSTGFFSWTVPSGTTQVRVEAWGAGCGDSANPGVGGGGAYASTANLAVSVGATIYMSVGLGSLGAATAANGANSWVNISSNAAPTANSEGCRAEGGLRSNASGTAGLGGRAANSIGTIVYSGGASPPNTTRPGGGGGGAGSGGAGANGASSPAPAPPGGSGGADDGRGGGGGGSGGAANTNASGSGVVGTAPGGGTGGSGGSSAGTRAANGMVRISWYS